MPFTKEQKQVAKKFREKYFDPVLIGDDEGRIPVDEFLQKTRSEQDDIIKAWTQERYNKMITLEGNLTAQQDRVANQKAIAKKALLDWGIIV